MENVTLNQIAYEIFEAVRGHISDDDDISIEQIKDMVHDTRARLLKQKFDKNPRVIDNAFVQSLGALEIEPVDSSAHSSIKAGRYMYRIKLEIPQTIVRHNSEGTFTRIGPADKLAVEYNFLSYNRALYSGNGRFNKDMIFSFLRDSKIYIISNSGLFHKGVQFIGVSLDDDIEDLRGFVKQFEVGWPQIFDGKRWQGAIPGLYHIQAIPTMVLLDRESKVRYVGSDTEAVTRIVTTLLSESKDMPLFR